MIPKHFILWNIIRNNIFESLELKDFSKLNPLVEKIVYESERYFTDNSPDVNDHIVEVNKTLVEALEKLLKNCNIAFDNDENGRQWKSREFTQNIMDAKAVLAEAKGEA